jgi:hypothetical protein
VDDVVFAGLHTDLDGNVSELEVQGGERVVDFEIDGRIGWLNTSG